MAWKNLATVAIAPAILASQISADDITREDAPQPITTEFSIADLIKNETLNHVRVRYENTDWVEFDTRGNSLDALNTAIERTPNRILGKLEAQIFSNVPKETDKETVRVSEFANNALNDIGYNQGLFVFTDNERNYTVRVFGENETYSSSYEHPVPQTGKPDRIIAYYHKQIIETKAGKATFVTRVDLSEMQLQNFSLDSLRKRVGERLDAETLKIPTTQVRKKYLTSKTSTPLDDLVVTVDPQQAEQIAVTYMYAFNLTDITKDNITNGRLRLGLERQFSFDVDDTGLIHVHYQKDLSSNDLPETLSDGILIDSKGRAVRLKKGERLLHTQYAMTYEKDANAGIRAWPYRVANPRVYPDLENQHPTAKTFEELDISFQERDEIKPITTIQLEDIVRDPEKITAEEKEKAREYIAYLRKIVSEGRSTLTQVTALKQIAALKHGTALVVRDLTLPTSASTEVKLATMQKPAGAEQQLEALTTIQIRALYEVELASNLLKAIPPEVLNQVYLAEEKEQAREKYKAIDSARDPLTPGLTTDLNIDPNKPFEEKLEDIANWTDQCKKLTAEQETARTTILHEIMRVLHYAARSLYEEKDKSGKQVRESAANVLQASLDNLRREFEIDKLEELTQPKISITYSGLVSDLFRKGVWQFSRSPYFNVESNSTKGTNFGDIIRYASVHGSQDLPEKTVTDRVLLAEQLFRTINTERLYGIAANVTFAPLTDYDADQEKQKLERLVSETGSSDLRVSRINIHYSSPATDEIIEGTAIVEVADQYDRTARLDVPFIVPRSTLIDGKIAGSTIEEKLVSLGADALGIAVPRYKDTRLVGSAIYHKDFTTFDIFIRDIAQEMRALEWADKLYEVCKGESGSAKAIEFVEAKRKKAVESAPVRKTSTYNCGTKCVKKHGRILGIFGHIDELAKDMDCPGSHEINYVLYENQEIELPHDTDVRIKSTFTIANDQNGKPELVETIIVRETGMSIGKLGMQPEFTRTIKGGGLDIESKVPNAHGFWEVRRDLPRDVIDIRGQGDEEVPQRVAMILEPVSKEDRITRYHPLTPALRILLDTHPDFFETTGIVLSAAKLEELGYKNSPSNLFGLVRKASIDLRAGKTYEDGRTFEQLMRTAFATKGTTESTDKRNKRREQQFNNILDGYLNKLRAAEQWGKAGGEPFTQNIESRVAGFDSSEQAKMQPQDRASVIARYLEGVLPTTEQEILGAFVQANLDGRKTALIDGKPVYLTGVLTEDKFREKSQDITYALNEAVRILQGRAYIDANLRGIEDAIGDQRNKRFLSYIGDGITLAFRAVAYLVTGDKQDPNESQGFELLQGVKRHNRKIKDLKEDRRKLHQRLEELVIDEDATKWAVSDIEWFARKCYSGELESTLLACSVNEDCSTYAQIYEFAWKSQDTVKTIQMVYTSEIPHALRAMVTADKKILEQYNLAANDIVAEKGITPKENVNALLSLAAVMNAVTEHDQAHSKEIAERAVELYQEIKQKTANGAPVQERTRFKNSTEELAWLVAKTIHETSYATRTPEHRKILQTEQIKVDLDRIGAGVQLDLPAVDHSSKDDFTIFVGGTIDSAGNLTDVKGNIDVNGISFGAGYDRDRGAYVQVGDQPVYLAEVGRPDLAPILPPIIINFNQSEENRREEPNAELETPKTVKVEPALSTPDTLWIDLQKQRDDLVQQIYDYFSFGPETQVALIKDIALAQTQKKQEDLWREQLESMTPQAQYDELKRTEAQLSKMFGTETTADPSLLQDTLKNLGLDALVGIATDNLSKRAKFGIAVAQNFTGNLDFVPNSGLRRKFRKITDERIRVGYELLGEQTTPAVNDPVLSQTVDLLKRRDYHLSDAPMEDDNIITGPQTNPIPVWRDTPRALSMPSHILEDYWMRKDKREDWYATKLANGLRGSMQRIRDLYDADRHAALQMTTALRKGLETYQEDYHQREKIAGYAQTAADIVLDGILIRSGVKLVPSLGITTARDVLRALAPRHKLDHFESGLLDPYINSLRIVEGELIDQQIDQLITK